MAEKLEAGCDATAIIFYEGQRVDEVPDHLARARFQKMVIEVSGDAAPTKIEHSGELTLTVEEQRREQNRVFGNMVGIK